MPPKTTFTEEKILDAALAIVRREGLEAVTARAIGKELGCSPKPLFTAFRNMEEVLAGTVQRARQIFESYMKNAYEGHVSFRRIGLRWIRFAGEEPQLYRLLFMQAGQEPLALNSLSANFAGLEELVLSIIRQDFDLPEAAARGLYNQMLIHAHGIACLQAAGHTRFAEEEIKQIYTEAVMGLVMYYKAKEKTL